MLKIFSVVCFLVTLLGTSTASTNHAPSEAPSLPPTSTSQCSSIIYDMVECLPFLSNGSKETKPASSCCSGFKSVLKVNATCICEAIKSSAQLGIELNITRAANLHSACKVSASPLSKCGIISHDHTGTPAVHNPPKSSPKTAPSPKSGASSVPTPSPANAHGGAYSISASFLVFTSMLVIYFSCVSNLF